MHYQNPLGGLTDSQRMRTGGYASYTEAMVDNRLDADIDKTVPGMQRRGVMVVMACILVACRYLFLFCFPLSRD
jgi:hypothetical protein